MASLEGKRIAVFGCATGFGKSVSLDLAKAGASLCLFDKTAAGTEVAELIRKRGQQARFFEMDVCRTESVEEVFNQAFSPKGMNGMVYLPRAREERDFIKTQVENWENDINVALRGAFFVAKGILPFIKKESSADRFILFVSSVLSQVVGVESVGYHVAKAGLDQLTRYLAVRLGPDGIRVNAIQIGIAIKDESQAHFYSEANRFQREIFIKSHPLRRLGTATDVSNAALFLISESSRFVTGQVLCVDGGLTLQEPVHLLNSIRSEMKL
jgi:3-oxoacyl-[acyl-carrier protein] reductase